MTHIARTACRAILFAPAVFLFASAACAAAPVQDSPDHFLRSLYMRYYPPGCTDASPFDTNESIRHFFEPALAVALIGSENGIDADPFIDAQDCFVTAVSIHVDRADAGNASATVRIRNDRRMRPVQLRFNLVHLSAGWRIFDIISSRGDSFRGEYIRKKHRPGTRRR